MIHKVRTFILPAASLLCLYILPHFLGDWSVPISATFAIVLIGSNRPIFDKDHLVKYAAYIAISIGTYYILFLDQPWEFLFGWLPGKIIELTGLPVSGCSIIMSLAGCLLLPRLYKRRYLLITLLIQIPLAMAYDFSVVESALGTSAKFMRYTNSGQSWQFLWMVNYYLPIYLWSRKKCAAPRV